VTVTDQAGRWKTYETDAFDNVTKVTEPNPQGGANHETTYAYDMLNRLTTVTMPRSGTTQTRQFAYNTLGQLQSTVNPENGTTTLAYNTDGSLFSKTDQKTQRIEYSYDSFQRVSQVRKYLPGYQTDDPCQRVNYYYDTNPFESTFTQNGWGRLAVAEYGEPTCTGGQYRESYSYTSGGLPVKKKLWVYDSSIGVGSLLGEWSYDNEGKMLTVKYPDTYDSQGNPLTGRTYTNGYDSAGRLATLVDNRPGNYTWISGTAYNDAGQVTQLTGTNFSEQREYNERLQVTRINYPGLTDTHYYYPANPLNDGRIARRNVNGVNKAYTYDSLGRLATAGSASYTYDGFGNRLQQTSPAMYLTYNASNNRITSTGYSYDDNGNLTAMPNLTMSYDVENRLAQAQTPAVTENYRYAPSGQRVWKQKSGSNEWYFYGVDGRLIGTYVPCQYYGTLFQEQSTNVYFGGRTLQAQNITGIKQDRLGTTSYTTTTYAPYGDTGISPPPYGDGLGFTGYYRDGTSTGLDYAQQRYYAPSIGRFTSADPYMPSAAIAKPQSWNRYAYVSNDPVNFVDPSGLKEKGVPDGVPITGPFCSINGFMFFGPVCDWQIDDFAWWEKKGIKRNSTDLTGGGIWPFDALATSFAQVGVKQRLQGFERTNCARVLKEFGFDASRLRRLAENTPFMDAREFLSPFWNMTEDRVSGNHQLTAISAQDPLRPADAKVLNTGSHTVVLLYANFFSAPQDEQNNILLHELFHVAGWGDKQIFDNWPIFSESGVSFGSHDITRWLQGDCKPIKPGAP
jgi:RHS repeat-associated protein